MRKITILLSVALLAISCKQSAKEESVSPTAVEQINEEQQNEDISISKSDKTARFEIEEIPFSEVALGEFPYIEFPEGIEQGRGSLDKPFDLCFILIDGEMKPLEGRLYKANVSAVHGVDFSQYYFEKSMAKYLESIGAVKISEGAIDRAEYDRYRDQATNVGGAGDIGYWNEKMTVYVLRSEVEGDIYIQYVSDNASAKLNVLQVQELK